MQPFDPQFQQGNQLQGNELNPGAIPLQDNHPINYRQTPQMTPYLAPQPQQLFNQQQPQRGVDTWNLKYLAENHTPRNAPNYALPPGMVNVAWANHPVPYSQSLHPPQGWHPVGTQPGERVVGKFTPGDTYTQAPHAPAPAPHPSLLRSLLRLF